jgi:hypothetical protein
MNKEDYAKIKRPPLVKNEPKQQSQQVNFMGFGNRNASIYERRVAYGMAKA